MSVRAEEQLFPAPFDEPERAPALAPGGEGREPEDEALLRPVLHTTWRFWAIGAVLGAVALWGANAYLVQFRWGLGVTGLNRPNYWGIYITNFVFFIGISHAGTLISAILRIARAEWRRSITRSAEVITVLVIFFGIGNILIDMGRPDRLLNVLRHGRFQSPLLWDVVSVSTYLTGSTIYLFLPLIPDIAILRDRTAGIRHRLYRLLALGWRGTPRQHRILEVLISIMAVVVIPIAVSVHTVVSFVFAMTIQPMWHSAIFGPYFVVGAIFSGIAALILAMAVIRSVYGLHDYLREIHFNYLGVLLLIMSLLWSYFTFGEYLVTFYGSEPVHMAVWWSKIAGPFAPAFWTMVACCLVVPFVVLCNRRTRTVKGTVLASVTVIIGMWLERWTIVVPSLSSPRLPGAAASYFPTWVEWSIFAGCVAAFTLLYMVFTKVFPIVSIWEIREGREAAVLQVVERVRSYLPPGAAEGRAP
ncbi:MAG TPA: NrfD/PsrC family molybdoenzyme membrane anchor subunit [Anaeromyxobacter sp.]